MFEWYQISDVSSFLLFHFCVGKSNQLQLPLSSLVEEFKTGTLWE